MGKQQKAIAILEFYQVLYLFFVAATSAGTTPAVTIVVAAATTGLYDRLILSALTTWTSSIHTWIHRTSGIAVTVLRCVKVKTITGIDGQYMV